MKAPTATDVQLRKFLIHSSLLLLCLLVRSFAEVYGVNLGLEAAAAP
jgi:hypothetical protein